MENTPREAVQYTVLEKSLIGNEIFEAGTVCRYDGLPSENLLPMCDVGKARAAEYVESNKARIAKMLAENAPVDSNTDAFAKAVGKAIADANAVHAAQMAELMGKFDAALTQVKTAAQPAESFA